jgi:CubicO group peptidase (beta-lactamase class C family)
MKKIRSLIFLFTLLFSLPLSFHLTAESASSAPLKTNPRGRAKLISTAEIRKIENWIRKQMTEGKIPGTAAVIVQGDQTVYQKGFGYADLKTKRSVSSKTLFEMGSNSKAFTALGILKLESQGKIQLNDPVQKYLPCLRMKYIGKYQGKRINRFVEITIEQLLHHTSGIPFKTFADIPIGNDPVALERTVRVLVNRQLDFYPGERFQYTTINYDILGLIIQQVSGIPYESYLKQYILKPLGLYQTYLFQEEALRHDLATGYKLGYLKPDAYDAPRYRGNTPAGYYFMNMEDLAKWLKIQLGTGIPTDFDQRLIAKSHLPDRSVPPSITGSSYAAGWEIYQSEGGEISHGGSNPNYSSFIVFRPKALFNSFRYYTGKVVYVNQMKFFADNRMGKRELGSW